MYKKLKDFEEAQRHDPSCPVYSDRSRIFNCADEIKQSKRRLSWTITGLIYRVADGTIRDISKT